MTSAIEVPSRSEMSLNTAWLLSENRIANRNSHSPLSFQDCATATPSSHPLGHHGTSRRGLCCVRMSGTTALQRWDMSARALGLELGKPNDAKCPRNVQSSAPTIYGSREAAGQQMSDTPEPDVELNISNLDLRPVHERSWTAPRRALRLHLLVLVRAAAHPFVRRPPLNRNGHDRHDQ